ncbi:hypothetical protein [Rhizobacter sp. OV335]|uniref:hypothetical protein n=1 Tax=Rhizobacter sp. OV335 TaxID=1500264 RepID=UPI0011611291|nr:hypothetical protein [Rhizobacter sp. OV335]
MHAPADKPQVDGTRSSDDSPSRGRRGAEAAPSSFDTPGGVAQRRMQEIVNNSPQARRTSKFQLMADNFATRLNAPIQGKFSFESSLANGWYAFLKKFSSRMDLFKLVERDEDLNITIKASDNNPNMKNKFGATLGMIETDDEEFVPIKHLGQEKHDKKMNSMKAMWLTIEVFGSPLVGMQNEEAVPTPRSLEEQLVTFAHEWHLHAVPYIELYQSIKMYRSNADSLEEHDLGEGVKIPRGEFFRLRMNDKLRSVLTDDQHKDYKTIAAFIKSVGGKMEDLGKLKSLQENPAVIEGIIGRLDSAMEDQGDRYDWDQDAIADELSKLT